MTSSGIKKFRIALIALAIALSTTMVVGSWDIFDLAISILSNMPASWWWFVFGALALQLGGHFLRMLRTKTVLDQVQPGSAAEQFGALGVGYLFNTLLPLRFGELLRTSIIATQLRISWLYTLTVIALERAADLLIVGSLVILVALFFSGHNTASSLLAAAIGAILVACAIIATALLLLAKENKKVLNLIWQMTSWLNVNLRNNIRFKVWSLIFGLQQFISNKPAMRKYAIYAVVSWFCYIGSMTLLVIPILKNQNPSQTFVTSTAPYVTISSTAGTRYISGYGQAMNNVLDTEQPPSYTQAYILISWMVITLPMAAIGLFALFVLKFSPQRRSRPTDNESFVNKLQRRHDFSQEFPAFLDSYFLGNELSRILHKLELSGKLSLVKFFKGGSDAITILVLSEGKLFVKKIIPLNYQDRLKAQYDWLKKYQKLPHLVKTLGEHHSKEYYAIDLAYDANDMPLFEYIHHYSLKESETVITEVWKSLYNTLHKNAEKARPHPRDRSKFIDKHIYTCLDIAAETYPELRTTLELETININGKKYDNLYQIMEKIKNHKQAWQDIATYQKSGVVHGDPFVDNILVSSKTSKPLIIDPAPDGNFIEGPLYDMAKFMQSFYGGYEFLFRDEEPVHMDNRSIRYRDHRTQKYSQLLQFIQKDLAPKYLTPPEQKSLVFLGAALFIRRLKYQVRYCPETTMKFYAVGVKGLNEFLDQYNK